MRQYLIPSTIFLMLPVWAGAQSFEEIVKQAEAKDAAMDTKGAMVLYKQAEKLKPLDPGVLIGLSKQHGESMVGIKEAEGKKKSGKIALDYALKAVEVAPDLCDAHLSVAVCYGRLLDLVGAKEKVRISRYVKEYADTAIKLDPKSDYAWHMLGRWHRGVAEIKPIVKGFSRIVYGGIPNGSNAEAVDAFRKAIALNPNRVIHHIELGMALIAVGNKKDGRAAIQRGLAMPNRERDDKLSKQKGAEALAKL